MHTLSPLHRNSYANEALIVQRRLDWLRQRASTKRFGYCDVIKACCCRSLNGNSGGGRKNGGIPVNGGTVERVRGVFREPFREPVVNGSAANRSRRLEGHRGVSRRPKMSSPNQTPGTVFREDLVCFFSLRSEGRLEMVLNRPATNEGAEFPSRRAKGHFLFVANVCFYCSFLFCAPRKVFVSMALSYHEGVLSTER